MNNKIASMLSGMARFFNQKSTYLPKKNHNTSAQRRHGTKGAGWSRWREWDREVSCSIIIFTLSWRNGLALKSGFNRYIEAVVTAPLKPINRHPQTYIQSFVMPLPKYKPKRQVTDTKCIWLHLGPLFSCSWLWSAHRSDKLKCITSWKTKTEFS